MPRLALQLLVIALVALVQLSVCLQLGAGPGPGASSSQLVEEEELDDETLAEPVESMTVERASRRWEVEQRAPQQVHREPEPRPPSHVS